MNKNTCCRECLGIITAKDSLEVMTEECTNPTCKCHTPISSNGYKNSLCPKCGQTNITEPPHKCITWESSSWKEDIQTFLYKEIQMFLAKEGYGGEYAKMFVGDIRIWLTNFIHTLLVTERERFIKEVEALLEKNKRYGDDYGLGRDKGYLDVLTILKETGK